MQRLLLLAATSAALVGRGSLKPRRSIQRRVFGRQGIDLRPLRPLVDVVEEEYITADSKLTKDRSVVIVTTAAAVDDRHGREPRAGPRMVGTGYEDVTLLLPWLEDDADQKTLFNGRVFATKSDQETFVRAWIQKNAPDADASTLKLGWYPSRYATGLGSILNLDDITSHIPSDKNDIVILEEPEHLWYRNGPRWTSRFRRVCGIAHEPRGHAIADNEDKEGAPEIFNVRASETSSALQSGVSRGRSEVFLSILEGDPRRSCPSLTKPGPRCEIAK